MKTDEAIGELMRFRDVLVNGCPGMSFFVTRVASRDEPFKHWFREEVPGTNAAKKSGVYFISDLSDEILYIGKAAANNLAAEISGKLSRATELDENDTPTFGNSSLAKWAPDEKYKTMLVRGDILIRAIITEPQEFASLAEVYLHTLCARNGGLPVLNKRIG